MRIRCILVQRTCFYPGEFAPELWDAWSEYVIDENPQGYQDSLQKAHNAVGEYLDAVREIDIVLPDPVIGNLFNVPTVVLDS